MVRRSKDHSRLLSQSRGNDTRTIEGHLATKCCPKLSKSCWNELCPAVTEGYRRHRLQSAGSVKSSDVELPRFNNHKNVNNIQQQRLPPQHQQFQLQGTADQHASRGHRYLQLPAGTSTATTSTSISAGTTGSTFHNIYIICDTSVHAKTSHL